MGYRNLVTLGVTNEHSEDLKKIFKTFEYHEIPRIIINDEKRFIVEWDWIKWHEEYDFCNKIHRFLNDKENECYMVIIGEELNDIETYGYGEDTLKMYINRKVIVD